MGPYLEVGVCSWDELQIYGYARVYDILRAMYSDDQGPPRGVGGCSQSVVYPNSTREKRRSGEVSAWRRSVGRISGSGACAALNRKP